MDQGILTKYSASAGSGKTYNLTGDYLTKLLKFRTSYKKILAVTFTNKAASDMKRKILEQLYDMANGKRSTQSARLSKATNKSEEVLGREAKEILENILHDYSRFSVGTIDSFFQKVLRAFTREIGLQSGYIIELDHSLILQNAVNDMLESIGDDKALKNWLTEYALTRVEDGKNWNLKNDIMSLSEEIFREKFKLLTPEEREKLKSRELLFDYVKELKSLISDFKNSLREYAIRGNEILDKYNVVEEMFFHGKQGVPAFIKMLIKGPATVYKPVSSWVTLILDDPPRWTTKPRPAPELSAALKDGFAETMIDAVRFYTANYITANTAGFIFENIYNLGILADVLDHVHIITSAENKFLLSDAGELLHLIIEGDQTPFIYEKVGNAFEHFMIDEFQDTSEIQWKNFKPLIENSMAEGHDNLVVGDVKQAIYRWRNSDWRIFGKTLHEQIDPERLKVEHLETNWRSRKNIIAFNNTVFSLIPEQIDRSEKNVDCRFSLKDLYSDARQLYPGNKEDGFIKIEFIEETEDMRFDEIVPRLLPQLLEDLQDKGYKGSDIGILVRTNAEGSEVLKTILDYQSRIDDEKRKKYNYDIISNESLILGQSPVVNFIISLLTCLYDKDDDLSKALMFRNYLLCTRQDLSFAGIVSADELDKEGEKVYPAGYKWFLDHVRQMPIFEAIENIINFFNLGNYPLNAAYLYAFQDCVLEFSGSISSGIPTFLEWWKTTGIKRSIVLSDQQDSIRVMTIHKSKGLQFRVVILPFLTWNLGHGRKNPIMWVKPEEQPFNKLGLVPVKYKNDLQYSYFADNYNEESYSAMIDNLNLLYVAFTRAIDCLFGFCPNDPRSSASLPVATALKDALQCETNVTGEKPGLILNKYFDVDRLIFTCGQIPENISGSDILVNKPIETAGYFVSKSTGRLRLKLHGDNWFTVLPDEQKRRLNYGRIMHEIFESVSTAEDIPPAIKKMVLEGKIPENTKKDYEDKILRAVSAPGIREWFEPGLKVMNEAEILTVAGTAKRPDRIIFKNDKVIIVDFKFGIEKNDYKNQIGEYRDLLSDMGYNNIEAFLWYVDNNKIISV